MGAGGRGLLERAARTDTGFVGRRGTGMAEFEGNRGENHFEGSGQLAVSGNWRTKVGILHDFGKY